MRNMRSKKQEVSNQFQTELISKSKKRSEVRTKVLSWPAKWERNVIKNKALQEAVLEEGWRDPMSPRAKEGA